MKFFDSTADRFRNFIVWLARLPPLILLLLIVGIALLSLSIVPRCDAALCRNFIALIASFNLIVFALLVRSQLSILKKKEYLGSV